MMLFDVYLKNKKQYLPFWFTTIIISLLSLGIYYSKTFYFSLILVIFISVYSIYYYKKYYLPILKLFLITACILSLITFSGKVMFSIFWKALGYAHLTLLFSSLCPPTSLKNNAVKICLVFMPYFENHINNIITASRLKGVKLKTKNPIIFIFNGARLIIPIMVIFVSTMQEVIIALKIKGY